MMTGRQTLIQDAVRHIYLHNYEAWRLEIGESTETRIRSVIKIKLGAKIMSKFAYTLNTEPYEGYPGSRFSLIKTTKMVALEFDVATLASDVALVFTGALRRFGRYTLCSYELYTPKFEPELEKTGFGKKEWRVRHDDSADVFSKNLVFDIELTFANCIEIMLKSEAEYVELKIEAAKINASRKEQCEVLQIEADKLNTELEAEHKVTDLQAELDDILAQINTLQARYETVKAQLVVAEAQS